MNAFCLSDEYCQYKSDTGYCGYTAGTAGCVKNNSVTIGVPNTPSWSIMKVVDISTDSIEAIAEAVAKKLRGEIGGIVRCKDCACWDTGWCSNNDIRMGPDDYCSMPERKES